jgi:hypothetical protein
LIQQIEIDIQKKLRTSNDLNEVCDSIWKKWKDSQFDLESINSFCSFLFEAQEWEKLISLSISQIKLNAPVSWDYLGETLNKVKDETLKTQLLQACLDLFKMPNYEIPFLKTFVFDIIYPKARKWRKFYLKKREKKLEENRATLIAQLNMFKHSVNFSEYEKNILIKIEKMYPNDSEIKKLTELASNRESHDLLKKYGHKYQIEKYNQNSNQKSDNKLINILFNESKRLIRTSDNPLDFVYIFIFIEAYDEALLLIEKLPQSEVNNWLIMEILMLAKKYTQALSWTNFLEEKITHQVDLEKLSQVYYFRARCLWELNQKSLAIETIENLIQWNPEYRLANHLLYEWKSVV